jgi:hypothetical protein
MTGLVIYSPVDRVRFDYRGLQVAGQDLSYDEWEVVYNALASHEHQVFMVFMWSWGDILAYGEAVHGQKYTQAMSRSNRAYQTLANYKWLAEKTPRELRGIPGLGQAHYEAVVKVDDFITKFDLLILAGDEGWSAKKLEGAVTKLLGPGEEKTNSTPPQGSMQDELDLAQQQRYILEQQNMALKLEQDLIQDQVSEAQRLLNLPEPDVKSAARILGAEVNGQIMDLVRKVITLYRQGDMTAMVDTLDELSLLLED